MKRAIPAIRMPGAGTVRNGSFLNPAALIAVILIVLGTIPLSAQEDTRDYVPEGASFDGILAADLVGEARRLIEREDLQGARFLLERAHAIDPDSGDALYLLTTLEPHQRDTVQWREQLLRRAGELSLESVAVEDLLADLARLLVDTGRAAEAVDLLDGHIRERDGIGAVHGAMAAVLSGDTGEPRPATLQTLPSLEILFLEALLRDNPGWFSAAVLARMRSRYPEDTRLALLDWRRYDVLVPSFPEWLGPALSESAPDNRDALRDILLHYLALLPADVEEPRRGLARRYYEDLDGRDPLPALMVLLLPGADTLPAYLEDYSFPGESKRLWEFLATHRDPRDWPRSLPAPLRLLLEDILDRPAVEIIRRDAATFAAESYHLEHGQLLRWTRDTDGNGMADVVLEIHSPEAASLYERYNDRVTRIDYSPFPMVSRVWSIPLEGDGIRRWTVLERERIVRDGGRRWNPVTPVPFDPGLHGPHAGRSGAQALVERLSLARSIHSRFDRQLASDDAIMLSPLDEEETTRYLRSVGMMR